MIWNRHVLGLPLIAVACGGGGGAGHPTDASVGDSAGSDRSPVTLTVTRNGQPVMGVHTYFLDPDNTVAATVDTDATGTASARVSDGGSVTALDPFKPSQPDPSRAIELRTYLGVKAGDRLTMTQDDPSSITVTVKAPMLSGQNRYDVLTTCGANSLGLQPTGTVALSRCNGIADILVTATASGAGATGRFALYRAGVPVADGATIDLTGEAFQPQREVAFHYSHVPGYATTVSVFHEFAAGHGTIATGGILFDDTTNTIQNGEATITLQVPDIAGVTALLEHVVTGRGHHVVTEIRPLAASFDLDLSGLLLPEWTDSPRYDAASRRIVWTDAADGVAPDLTLATLGVSPVATTTPRWNWQLVGPYTTGELKLPALPTDVATWAPAPGDSVEPGRLQVKLPGGYDAIRALLFDQVAGDAFVGMLLGRGERFLKTED